jgi:hypothetical protein
MKVKLTIEAIFEVPDNARPTHAHDGRIIGFVLPGEATSEVVKPWVVWEAEEAEKDLTSDELRERGIDELTFERELFLVED